MFSTASGPVPSILHALDTPQAAAKIVAPLLLGAVPVPVQAVTVTLPNCLTAALSRAWESWEVMRRMKCPPEMSRLLPPCPPQSPKRGLCLPCSTRDPAASRERQH